MMQKAEGSSPQSNEETRSLPNDLGPLHENKPSDGKAWDFIDYALSKKIVNDQETKKVIFLTMLQASTGEGLNTYMRGPPAIGKTWIATNVAQVFPKDRVIILGGLSPMALIYEHGIQEPDPQVKQPEKLCKNCKHYSIRKHRCLSTKEAFDPDDSCQAIELIVPERYVVDLSKKIVILLDKVRQETYEMLRPLASHDQPEITYNIASKTRAGDYRTKHIVLRGHPSFVFCTSILESVDEDSSRSFTITPESSHEKRRNALGLQAELICQDKTDDPDVESVRQFLERFWAENHDKPKIPFAAKLAEKYPVWYGDRAMRDHQRFLLLIQSIALMNGHEEATEDDFEEARDLFVGIIDTTITGLSRVCIEFFKRILKSYEGSLTPVKTQDIKTLYKKEFHRPIDPGQLTRILKSLDDVGWIELVEDSNDRRRKEVKVLGNQVSLSEEIKLIDLFDHERCNDNIQEISLGTTNQANERVVQKLSYISKSNKSNNVIPEGVIPEGPNEVQNEVIPKTTSQSPQNEASPAEPEKNIHRPRTISVIPEGPTCGQCAKHLTVQCTKKKPELIRYEAAFAGSCHSFQPREAAE